jgi:anti-anti-sigma factor
VAAVSSPLLQVSSSRPEPDTVIVNVAGEVDAATAPEVGRVLDAVWASAPSVVVLDLSLVSFLGTAGLAELQDAADRADADRVTLRLVGGPRPVERALRIAGLRASLPAEI